MLQNISIFPRFLFNWSFLRTLGVLGQFRLSSQSPAKSHFQYFVKAEFKMLHQNFQKRISIESLPSVQVFL